MLLILIKVLINFENILDPGRRTKSKRKKVPKYKEKKAAKIKQKPVPQDQQIDMNESNQLTIKSWNSPQIEEILRNSK